MGQLTHAILTQRLHVPVVIACDDELVWVFLPLHEPHEAAHVATAAPASAAAQLHIAQMAQYVPWRDVCHAQNASTGKGGIAGEQGEQSHDTKPQLFAWQPSTSSCGPLGALTHQRVLAVCVTDKYNANGVGRLLRQVVHHRSHWRASVVWWRRQQFRGDVAVAVPSPATRVPERHPHCIQLWNDEYVTYTAMIGLKVNTVLQRRVSVAVLTPFHKPGPIGEMNGARTAVRARLSRVWCRRRRHGRVSRYTTGMSSAQQTL